MYLETAAVSAEHTQAPANLSLVTTPDWDRAKGESDTLAMIVVTFRGSIISTKMRRSK